MQPMLSLRNTIPVFVLLFLCSAHKVAAQGQSILERRISVDVTRQRLDDVLSIIGNKGGFSFSYNSNILKRDSLVTISAANKPVRVVLNQLFAGNYEYKESGNYIILRRVSLQLTTVTKVKPAEERMYTISGYVVNSETGDKVPYASIYERKQLVSALSDADGHFSLRLRSKQAKAAISVSKYSFEDTTLMIEPSFDMKLEIAIVPQLQPVYTSVPNLYERADTANRIGALDSIKPLLVTHPPADKRTSIEKTSFGNLLLSPKQKVSSLNLRNFFATRPFQLSLVPLLSTQGKMSGQVVNNFSFNVLGGYTGGVNGVEFGGLFNINRRNVRFLQIAGLFNMTGGSVDGVQFSGLSNTVLDSLNGVQISGVTNFTRGKLNGVQTAGFYNHVNDTMRGLQVSGFANYTRKKMSGTQIAGLANFANRSIEGVQIAPVFNYAKRMKGVQLGLINIADTIDGIGLGLINIVVKGYHKLSVYSNEVVNLNMAFKTGQHKFYNIIAAGMHVDSLNQATIFGYGIGSEFKLTKWLWLNPELTTNIVYLGTWDYFNSLERINLNLNFRITRWLTVFGGASYSLFHRAQPEQMAGYKFDLAPEGHQAFTIGRTAYTGWGGWNVGVNFF